MGFIVVGLTMPDLCLTRTLALSSATFAGDLSSSFVCSRDVSEMSDCLDLTWFSRSSISAAAAAAAVGWAKRVHLSQRPLLMVLPPEEEVVMETTAVPTIQ